MKMLQDKKTKLAFTMHDSIVLDVAREESNLIKKIKEVFDTTDWGAFSSTCKIGKNFGDMRRIEV